MIQRILLPLEDGDDDTRAVELTRRLARQGVFDVLLLRVEEWPMFGSGGIAWTAAFRAGNLTTVKERLGGTSLRVRALSREAITSEALLNRAQRGRASLIVISYHPETGWSRWMQCRPAQRLLVESPIPVLAVPEGGRPDPGPIRRILYVHEGGEEALQSSRIAIEIAQAHDAAGWLLESHLPPPRRLGFLPSWLRRALGAPAVPAAAAEEPAVDGTLAELFSRRGVPVDALPPSDDAEAAVAAAVREREIDLVVLAARRRSDRAAAPLVRYVLETLQKPLLLSRGPAVPDAGGSSPRLQLRF